MPKVKSSPVRAKTNSRNARPAEWQLQDAKARFCEVFRLARESGPQRVTRHGKSAVVVLPAEDYERLRAPARPKGSLARFFAESPLAASGVRLSRRRDFGRDVDL